MNKVFTFWVVRDGAARKAINTERLIYMLSKDEKLNMLLDLYIHGEIDKEDFDNYVKSLNLIKDDKEDKDE